MNMNIRRILKDSAVLLIITLIAGLLLGYVHQITLEPIRKEQENRKNKAYQSVMADGKIFESQYDEWKELSFSAIDNSLSDLSYLTVKEVALVKNEEEEEIGYVLNLVTSQGYQGGIQIVVGIDMSRQITGVSILKITETAGLGMNALKPEFLGQFTKYDKVKIFKVVKDKSQGEGHIDALSGATITTDSIVNEVNGALALYDYIGGQ